MTKKQSSKPKKTTKKPKFDYTGEGFLARISALAQKGYTDKEIALTIGLSESTFFAQKAAHSEISEALSSARAQINSVVRAAFLKTALGGRLVRTTQYIQKRCECKGQNPDCEICDGMGWITPDQHKVVTETELAPNLMAQQRWLLNYDKEWRKQSFEKTVETDDNPPRTLTKDEAREIWEGLDKSI